MRYKKDNDNRYRVNFMQATEELMDAFTVKQFISYLEENAEFEDDDTMYLDGHVVNTKIYMLRETKNLRKEFIITEDSRLFYWLSVIQKIELVDEEHKMEIEQETWKAILNLMDEDDRFMASWEVEGEFTYEKFLAEYLKLDPEFEDVLKLKFDIKL